MQFFPKEWEQAPSERNEKPSDKIIRGLFVAGPIRTDQGRLMLMFSTRATEAMASRTVKGRV